MRTWIRRALGLASAAHLLLVAAAGQAQDIGLTVLLQPWTPQTDDDEARTVLRDPALISNGFTQAFQVAKPLAQQRIVDYLQRADLLADGVTLYDLALDISQPTLSLAAISGGGETPAAFTAAVRFARIHVQATSTTPDVVFGIGFDGDLDPSCSLDFGLAIDLPIHVGHDASQPLEADDAPAQQPLVRVTSLDLDSSNFSCDVIDALLSITGLEDMLRGLVTDPNGEVAWAMDAALRPALKSAVEEANAQVSAVVPAGLQVKSWASPNMITLAFAPARLAFDSVTGNVHGLVTSTTSNTAATSYVSPASLAVRAFAKLGPRPLLLPNGELGEAPLEQLTAQLVADAANGPAAYELRGLAANLPNYVTIGSYPGCQVSDPSSTAWRTEVENFAPGVILPAQIGSQIDLVAESHLVLCGANTPEIPPSKWDRVVDPPYIDKTKVVTKYRY